MPNQIVLNLFNWPRLPCSRMIWLLSRPLHPLSLQQVVSLSHCSFCVASRAYWQKRGGSGREKAWPCIDHSILSVNNCCMLFRGGSETREDEWEGNQGQDPSPAPSCQVILHIHKLKNFSYKNCLLPFTPLDMCRYCPAKTKGVKWGTKRFATTLYIVGDVF